MPVIDDTMPNPYAILVADLERETRVPLERQTTSEPAQAKADGGWTWDEDRRQTRLAGGA